MKFTLITVIILGWMHVGKSDYSGGDSRPPSCCHAVKNTRIPIKNIEEFFIQEATGVCGIKAVIFRTKRGTFLCSDPNDSWAIRAINHLRTLKNTKPFEETTRCYTSTTAPPIVTRIETSRPETEISKTTNQPTSVSKELDGDGCPENCYYTEIPTSIPVKAPVALGRLLSRNIRLRGLTAGMHSQAPKPENKIK